MAFMCELPSLEDFHPMMRIGGYRQVFGLTGIPGITTGSLLAAASQSLAGPVPYMRLSFLSTAAGQFRILTGFPLATVTRRRVDGFCTDVGTE